MGLLGHTDIQGHSCPIPLFPVMKQINPSYSIYWLFQLLELDTCVQLFMSSESNSVLFFFSHTMLVNAHLWIYTFFLCIAWKKSFFNLFCGYLPIVCADIHRSSVKLFIAFLVISEWIKFPFLHLQKWSPDKSHVGKMRKKIIKLVPHWGFLSVWYNLRVNRNERERIQYCTMIF